MRKFVFSGLLCLLALSSLAQQDLSAEVAKINRVLSRFSLDSVTGLYDYDLLQQKVELRRKVVYEISEEIDKVNYDIAVNIAKQKEVEDRIEATRQEFEKLLLLSYKNLDLYSQFGFVFSADNFNQAFKRFLFLQELSAFRKFQMDLLKNYQSKVKLYDSTVFVLRNSQKKLLALKTDERQRLEKALSRRNTIQRNMQRNSAQISAALNREKTLKRALNQRTTSGITLYRTKLASAQPLVLSKNSKQNRAFFDQKGKMRSPVDSSIIVSFFGKQKHPVLERVIINNDGIVYRTPQNAKVKAVHKGKVARVFQIPGAHNAVMITHGNYFTLYANLLSVDVVEKGEIETGQVLGRSANIGRYGLLRFQIWKESEPLNPGEWLADYF